MPHTNARRNATRRPSTLLTFFGLLGLITLTAGLLSFIQPAAHAATPFTVNSTGDGADSDAADNLCDDGSGACTLRAAIEQANATAGADTIGFSVTGTINLTGVLPDIIDSLTVNGPGSPLLTVRRDTGGDYRIFRVLREDSVGLVVGISGLTISNGRTPDGVPGELGRNHAAAGGGLWNGGALTLTDVTLTGNSTGAGGAGVNSNGGWGGHGGAIYNGGMLTLTDVTLTGNSTGAGGAGGAGGDGGHGGAIYNLSMLTMTGCVVRGNSTGRGGESNVPNGRGGGGGSGGGIAGDLSHSVVMTDCVVSENTSGAGGDSSGAGGRGGSGGGGGGLSSASAGMTLTRVSVNNNAAGGGGGAPLGVPGGGGCGGGIRVQFNGSNGGRFGGQVRLTDSTVSGNRAGPSRNGAPGGSGGGICGSGVMTLRGSTISGNVGNAGSAIASENWLSMTNTTVSGNRLTGSGGAIVNSNRSSAASTLTNCTITANEGPGFVVGSGLPNIGNTVVAGNGGGAGPDVSGAFNSQGHNLVGDVGGATGFTAAGDQVGASASPLDPRLGPLADNGGPTLTHAPLAGSPALDAGGDALAVDLDNFPLTTDQRGPGFPRIADADADGVRTVDVGAVEARPSVEDSDFFVRQHYRDFLSRAPDADGLRFWTNEIESCGSDAGCREVRRVNVSAAFFLSIEFQETGYLVYRVYKAAYGDAASQGVPGGVPVVRLQEFLPDTRRIGEGVVVGPGDWRARLEANRNAYTLEFVQRQRFVDAFPATLTPAQFVDALFSNAGVTPAAAERQAAVGEFGGESSSDPSARAGALRRVAEHPALARAEFRRAFVLMQYFGYLRRNPDDAPEPGLNFGGWSFWLGKLEEFNGDYVAAEMVKAFLDSGEYRKRFGQ